MKKFLDGAVEGALYAAVAILVILFGLLLTGCASTPNSHSMTRLTVTYRTFVQSDMAGRGSLELKIHIPPHPENRQLHIELIGNDATGGHYILTVMPVDMRQSLWLVPFKVRRGYYNIRVALVTVKGHEFVNRGELRVL